MKRSSLARAGFTLLEIMMVVLIIGLLITMAVKMTGNLDVARETTVRAHLQSLKTALLMYEGSNGFAPSTEQGLKALVTKPTSEPQPRAWRPFLDQPILDPWQQEYFYQNPGTHNPKSYDLFSAGPDRKPNTPDDIGNWENKTN